MDNNLISTIDEISFALNNYLIGNSESEDILLQIKKSTTDTARISLAFHKLISAKLFPLIWHKKEEKSKKLSEEYRCKGNQSFQKKSFMAALKEYTLAVGCAPNDSEELALAYANRSAVTNSLQRHEESLIDIDRTLNLNYPESLKYKMFDRKGRILFHLGHYCRAEEVLHVALKYLKQSKISDVKRTKLEEDINNLISECQAKIDVEKSTLSEFSPPEFRDGKNEKIESGSSVIEIRFSTDMGRHIIAASDIQPGDVLAIENPFASVLLPDSYSTHCFLCQKRSHCLIPCPHCTKVFYCNKDCLKKSWESCHQVECIILPTLLSMGCTKMELLAVRVLLTATKQGSNFINLASTLGDLDNFESPSLKGCRNGTYLSSDYISIHHLETNSNIRAPSDLFSRAVTAACIIEIIDQCTDFFKSIDRQSSEQTKVSIAIPIFPSSLKIEESKHVSWQKILAGGLLLRYLQSMPCNAHEVSEMYIMERDGPNIVQSNEIGAAVYPLLSLINHSCDPNVVRHSYNGDTVVLRAIQAIESGEQIFDNYGYHHAVHNLAYRTKNLESQYYFKCECVACIEDWPLYHSLPDQEPIYFPGADIAVVENSSEKFKKILEEVLEGDYRNKLPFLYSHLILLQASVKRPWKEYSGCQETIKQCLCLDSNHYITSFY